MKRRFFDDDPSIPDLVQIVQSEIIDLDALLIDHDADDVGTVAPEMAEEAREIEDEILNQIAGGDDKDDAEFRVFAEAPHPAGDEVLREDGRPTGQSADNQPEQEGPPMEGSAEETLGEVVLRYSEEQGLLNDMLARLDEVPITSTSEWVQVWREAVGQVEEVTRVIEQMSRFPEAHKLVEGLTNLIAGITSNLKQQGRVVAKDAIHKLIDSI